MGSDVDSDCSLDPAWTLCVKGTFLESVSLAPITSRRISYPGPPVERPSFFAEQADYAKRLQEKMNITTEDVAGRSSTASVRSRGSTGFSGFSGSWDLQEPEGAPPAHGFPSNGSIGHPVLCRQPCRETASCRASCSFCHQCSFGLHRRGQLDKKNRTTFRLMSSRGKVEILLGVMRAKVLELGLGAGATQALEEWHADLTTAIPVEETPGAPSGESKRLLRHFETLHLNDLCFVAGPYEDQLRTASIQLLEKIRDLRAAA